MIKEDVCVFEPCVDMLGDCTNCELGRAAHCLEPDCQVCPEEYHICLKYEGLLHE